MKALGVLVFVMVIGFPSQAQQAPYEVRTYINQYRQVNYDTAARAWRPDSLRVRTITDVLVTQALSANIHLRQATFNFKTGDSTTLLERYFDATRGFVDTSRTTFDWKNGGWVPKKKSLVKFAATTTANIELSYNGMAFDTVSKNIVAKDALGRTQTVQYWTYNAATHRRDSLPKTDSSFYQGDSKYPYRTVGYGLMRDRAGRMVYSVLYAYDSLQTDASGRQLYSVYRTYAYPGELGTLTRKWLQPMGDRSVQVEQVLQYFPDRTPPAPPTQTCRKYLNLNRADSVNTHYYVWDSTGFYLAERWLYYFPRPTGFYLSNRESLYIREALGPAGWYNNQTIKSSFHDSLDGRPTRIYYQILYRGGVAFQPYARQEFEVVSPELQPDPPKPQPIVFFIGPNPASSHITVKSSEPVDELILTTVLGQVFPLPVINNRAELKNIASALYHVAAISGGKVIGTARIIKQ